MKVPEEWESVPRGKFTAAGGTTGYFCTVPVLFLQGLEAGGNDLTASSRMKKADLRMRVSG